MTLKNTSYLILNERRKAMLLYTSLNSKARGKAIKNMNIDDLIRSRSGNVQIKEIILNKHRSLNPVNISPEPELKAFSPILYLRQNGNITEYKLGVDATALTGIKLYFDDRWEHDEELNQEALVGGIYFTLNVPDNIVFIWTTADNRSFTSNEWQTLYIQENSNVLLKADNGVDIAAEIDIADINIASI